MADPNPGQGPKNSGYVLVREPTAPAKLTPADKPPLSGENGKKTPEAAQLVERLIDRLKSI